jgi:type I restriction enzyme S subunit
LLQHGDLLFNRTNSAELVGKTSIFKGHPKYKQIVYASYLIRVRVDRDKIIPDYLNYWMNSPEALLIRNKLKNQQVGQANINGTKLKGIKFPFVADLKIQEKIVQEIESRFSVCDKMEEAINNSLEQAEALRQSILKQAFEGKLTEEWRKKHLDLISSENSAKALLERIKKERGALKNTKKRKK